MRTQTKIYVLLFLVGLFLLLLVYVSNSNNQYKNEIKSYDDFIENSSKLVKLQNKWRNKKEDKNLIKQIKTKFRPTFYKEKGKIHILDFNNVSKNNLDRIGKMLLNSDLIIKAMDLKKYNNKISLHVEVQI